MRWNRRRMYNWERTRTPRCSNLDSSRPPTYPVAPVRSTNLPASCSITGPYSAVLGTPRADCVCCTANVAQFNSRLSVQLPQLHRHPRLARQDAFVPLQEIPAESCEGTGFCATRLRGIVSATRTVVAHPLNVLARRHIRLLPRTNGSQSSLGPLETMFREELAHSRG